MILLFINGATFLGMGVGAVGEGLPCFKQF